jgi:hypothetical protein
MRRREFIAWLGSARPNRRSPAAMERVFACPVSGGAASSAKDALAAVRCCPKGSLTLTNRRR